MIDAITIPDHGHPFGVEAMEREIASESARANVARALYEVLVEGFGFGPRDLPTAADREWIRDAVVGPIHEATEVALHVLASRLSQTMDRAPDGLVERFKASHRWAELGWE
jgi:hypothetical protein